MKKNTRYRGICFYLDGLPDANGNIFKNVTIPKKEVPVTYNFNLDKRLGSAKLKKDHEKITADLDIGLDLLEGELRYAVVGGQVLQQEGNVITSFKIDQIAITEHPEDKNLPPIKRVKNGT